MFSPIFGPFSTIHRAFRINREYSIATFFKTFKTLKICPCAFCSALTTDFGQLNSVILICILTWCNGCRSAKSRCFKRLVKILKVVFTAISQPKYLVSSFKCFSRVRPTNDIFVLMRSKIVTVDFIALKHRSDNTYAAASNAIVCKSHLLSCLYYCQLLAHMQMVRKSSSGSYLFIYLTVQWRISYVCPYSIGYLLLYCFRISLPGIEIGGD